MILLVGLALGLANYSLELYESLGRSMVLQVIISLLIGYPSLVLGYNAGRYWPEDTPTYRWQLWLLPVFFLLGMLATEGQLLADYLLFNVQDYHPFQAGGVYLFNGILSSILGLMLNSWRPEAPLPTAKDPVNVPEIPRPEALTKIPLRKGETTAFVQLEDIIYFEAYDKPPRMDKYIGPGSCHLTSRPLLLQAPKCQHRLEPAGRLVYPLLPLSDPGL